MKKHEKAIPKNMSRNHFYNPTLSEIWNMIESAGTAKSRAILCMLMSGLRPSTIRALKYGLAATKNQDLKRYSIKWQLEKDEKNLVIIIDPEMKKDIVEAAAMNINRYYTFTPTETTEALKTYLKERKKVQTISDTAFLFPSNCRKYSSKERDYMPMTSQAIIKIVQNAARNAGLKQWKYVHPMSLRKTFYMTLFNQPKNSRLDLADIEFFMGHHINKFFCDYSSNIEVMREKFSKLRFGKVTE